MKNPMNYTRCDLYGNSTRHLCEIVFIVFAETIRRLVQAFWFARFAVISYKNSFALKTK